MMQPTFLIKAVKTRFDNHVVQQPLRSYKQCILGLHSMIIYLGCWKKFIIQTVTSLVKFKEWQLCGDDHYTLYFLQISFHIQWLFIDLSSISRQIGQPKTFKDLSLYLQLYYTSFAIQWSDGYLGREAVYAISEVNVKMNLWLPYVNETASLLPL